MQSSIVDLTATVSGVGAVARFNNFGTNGSGTGYITKIILSDNSISDANITYEPNATASLNLLGFGSNGFKQLVINGSGYVGINTTSPSYLLDVNGTGRFLTTTNGFITRFTGGTSSSILGGIFASTAAGFASIGVQSNHGFNIFTNDIDRLSISSTGAATFSSTLGINGVADNIKSGTYTPTSQDYANVTSATNYTAQYMRVGNVVTVSGKISTTSTAAATLSYFTLSLPITSSFTTEQQAAGHGTLKSLQTSDKDAVIYAGTGSNKVQFTYYTALAGASDIFYHFTYLIN